MSGIRRKLVVGILSFATAVFIFSCAQPGPQATDGKKSVTLSVNLGAPKDRWDALIKAAEQQYELNNPDIDLKVNYMVYPYDEMHTKLVTMAAARASADILSIDQIWLGEFVEAGYIKDITDQSKAWGIEDKLYAPYLEGCRYDNGYYAVWAWTDARLMWYRKDILESANIEASQLQTWQGFLDAVPQINKAADKAGIQGVAFPGEAWLVDWWFPFLFQNGGEILVKSGDGYKAGFDNDAGVSAAKFLQDMKVAGVEFPTVWKWGEEFAAGNYAVWFGGTWVLGNFPEDEMAGIKDKIGVDMFPAPAGKQSRTLNGGWLLAVPETSENPDIAWDFIGYMLEPDVLTPVLAKYGYLPTQKVIAQDPQYAGQMEQKIAFWKEYEDVLAYGAARPSIPEYPKVAEKLYEELSKIVYEKTTPEAAISSASGKINALWQ
ncbi:MAG: extracellular solute-binding protein [Dehalococcoidia bacterium]|nr:extracellular solute-binding protein [Dehalococcoidia bacterium]